jgi:hypothetical protein
MGWERGIEWHLVPTGGQHCNRQAERMMGILKKQVFLSFEGKKYTYEKTCNMLQEAAQIVNSCPLVAGPWAEKEPLCPEDFMLVRSGTGVLSVSIETLPQLIKRLCVVQEAKEEFWDRWVQEIFPSLLKQRKWYKYKRG